MSHQKKEDVFDILGKESSKSRIIVVYSVTCDVGW